MGVAWHQTHWVMTPDIDNRARFGPPSGRCPTGQDLVHDVHLPVGAGRGQRLAVLDDGGQLLSVVLDHGRGWLCQPCRRERPGSHQPGRVRAIWASGSPGFAACHGRCHQLAPTGGLGEDGRVMSSVGLGR